MKIVFKNTYKDYIHLNYYNQRRFPMIIIHIFLFGIGILFNTKHLMKSGILEFFIAFALYICFVYFCLFMIVLLLEIISHLLGRHKAFLCEHEMIFEDDHIIEKTKYNENKFKWEILKDIIDTKNYFLLFNTDLGAYMIPKKQLSESEIRELKQILDKRK